MTWRQIASIIGLLLLAAGPSMGIWWDALRGVAFVLLLVATGAQLLARLPIKVISRLLSALGLWASLIYLRNSADFLKYEQSRAMGYSLVGMAIAIAIVSLGPVFPIAARWRLYKLAWPTIAFCLLYPSTGISPTPLLVSLLVATFLWMTIGRSTGSPLTEGLDRLQNRSRRMLSVVEKPVVVKGKFGDSIRHFLLEYGLGSIPPRILGTPDGIEEIVRECLRFRHLATAWQVAYYARLGQGDYGAAARLMIEAQKFGFDDTHFRRALAYALYQDNNPAWTEVLQESWDYVGTAATLVDRSSYFDLDGGSSDIWPIEDPHLEEFRLRLRIDTPVNSSVPPAALEAIP